MWKPIEVLRDLKTYRAKYGKQFLPKVRDYAASMILTPLARRRGEREARYWETVATERTGYLVVYPSGAEENVVLPQHSLYKVAKLKGLELTHDEAELPTAAAVVKWTRRTVSDVAPRPGVRAINERCNDISKRRATDAFEKVFGYALDRDPRTVRGRIVAKSDENGLHDGRIVEGPVEPEPGVVYQKLIDSEANGFITEFRVPIVGAAVPFVYEKRRPVHARFANFNTSVAVRETEDVFSASEVQRLVAMAAQMGLDFGEIDVIRDKDDGRIYAIDVANTPWGPPGGIASEEGRRAMHRLADVFAKQFLHEQLAIAA